MSKPKLNSIDQLIINLSKEFSKISNFEITQTDKGANRLFNFVITKFSEIQDFKILYQKYYIPATNKAIAETKKEFKTSFYKKLINVSDILLKENYYDTIRLGYVGLFHKVENYVNDLLIEANLHFNEGKTGPESIEKYFEKKYNFKFNNWYSDIWLNKINWICNCVKHYDGFPKKEPKYKYLSHLPENEKIKINHQEFFEDIDYVANTYFQLKLSQVFSLSIFKMTTEDMEVDSLTEELKEKYFNLAEQVKQLMI
jgi:hypothetical protein